MVCFILLLKSILSQTKSHAPCQSLTRLAISFNTSDSPSINVSVGFSMSSFDEYCINGTNPSSSEGSTFHFSLTSVNSTTLLKVCRPSDDLSLLHMFITSSALKLVGGTPKSCTTLS